MYVMSLYFSAGYFTDALMRRTGDTTGDAAAMVITLDIAGWLPIHCFLVTHYDTPTRHWSRSDVGIVSGLRHCYLRANTKDGHTADIELIIIAPSSRLHTLRRSLAARR